MFFRTKKNFQEIPDDIIIPANINIVDSGIKNIGSPISGLTSGTGVTNHGHSVTRLIQARINDGTITIPNSGGELTDGDKGDITVSSDGTVWTVDNSAITNAKLANVATATFKGRTTSGTGAPEDLTKSQAQAILSVDDIITLTGVADGATTLGDFDLTIFNSGQTIKGVLQQIENLLVNLNTQPSGTNGLSVTPGTNVSGASSVNGGYSVIGQEAFCRVVSTLTLTSTGTTTVTLSQASFSPYTPANTMWQVNVRTGTTRVDYTISSNTNSALVTFTAGSSADHVIEVLGISRLV